MGSVTSDSRCRGLAIFVANDRTRLNASSWLSPCNERWYQLRAQHRQHVALCVAYVQLKVH